MELTVVNYNNTIKTDNMLATTMSLALISLRLYKKYESKHLEMKRTFINLLDANVPGWRDNNEFKFLWEVDSY